MAWGCVQGANRGRIIWPRETRSGQGWNPATVRDPRKAKRAEMRLNGLNLSSWLSFWERVSNPGWFATCYADHSGLELMAMFLPLPHKHCNCKRAPPCPYFGVELRDRWWTTDVWSVKDRKMGGDRNNFPIPQDAAAHLCSFFSFFFSFIFLSPVLTAFLNRNRRMVDENLSVGGRNHVGLKG